jgi:hypothetical protein
VNAYEDLVEFIRAAAAFGSDGVRERAEELVQKHRLSPL